MIRATLDLGTYKIGNHILWLKSTRGLLCKSAHNDICTRSHVLNKNSCETEYNPCLPELRVLFFCSQLEDFTSTASATVSTYGRVVLRGGTLLQAVRVVQDSHLLNTHPYPQPTRVTLPDRHPFAGKYELWVLVTGHSKVEKKIQPQNVNPDFYNPIAFTSEIVVQPNHESGKRKENVVINTLNFVRPKDYINRQFNSSLDERFGDFKLMEIAAELLEPHSPYVGNTAPEELQMELNSIQCNSCLKDKLVTVDNGTFYTITGQNERCLGRIERTNERRVFLVEVPDRVAKTLISIITAHVLPRSQILRTIYDNNTINNYQHFLDPWTGAYINTIEGTWNAPKKKERTKKWNELCLRNRKH
ncbi:hypothetical protein RF11_05656 [Thelohanellus kitauei]|uniref:Uncharacterized protein n=1 Tax=Thelohanellus kitauei TaxID=669202 RepID=A0A0C2MTR4_THEKT|nr:hypothetical protein RF11_05656 [Thelohanellus kitauei]